MRSEKDGIGLLAKLEYIKFGTKRDKISSNKEETNL